VGSGKKEKLLWAAYRAVALAWADLPRKEHTTPSLVAAGSLSRHSLGGGGLPGDLGCGIASPLCAYDGSLDTLAGGEHSG